MRSTARQPQRLRKPKADETEKVVLPLGVKNEQLPPALQVQVIGLKGEKLGIMTVSQAMDLRAAAGIPAKKVPAPALGARPPLNGPRPGRGGQQSQAPPSPALWLPDLLLVGRNATPPVVRIHFDQPEEVKPVVKDTTKIEPPKKVLSVKELEISTTIGLNDLKVGIAFV
jgi:hypothetical protein